MSSPSPTGLPLASLLWIALAMLGLGVMALSWISLLLLSSTEHGLSQDLLDQAMLQPSILLERPLGLALLLSLVLGGLLVKLSRGLGQRLAERHSQQS